MNSYIQRLSFIILQNLFLHLFFLQHQLFEFAFSVLQVIKELLNILQWKMPLLSKLSIIIWLVSLVFLQNFILNTNNMQKIKR